jgi:dTDP-D-glucose 4,6-dehydratase
MQQWLNSFENKVLLKTNSFDTLRDWTYLNDIPHAIHSIIKHNNNFKILNLVSPFILSDFDIMKTITKKINLLKSLNKKTRHNAAYSIYINKIKFKNWTSPQRAINLIRNLNEKN